MPGEINPLLPNGEINPFISSGNCYSGPRRTADMDMIPCGNDLNNVYEHVACCQAGDICLESSVCFNIDFGVTYISGCSDLLYEHPSCPNKFTLDDTPWLGLAYCNGTSEEWVLCDQKKKPRTLTKPDPCWCPKDKDDRPFTLSQSSVIPGTASLPTRIDGSIQFSLGHYPTQIPEPVSTTATAGPTASGESSSTSTTSTSSTSTSTTSTSSPSTSAPTPKSTGTDPTGVPDAGNESGLSPSAQIGTIAGGVAGALILVLLLAAFLCFRRRQKKKYLQKQEEDRAVENFMHEGVISKGGAANEADPLNLGIAAGGGGAQPSPSAASIPDTPALSELDSKAARPWSVRSELDNNQSARSSYSTAGSHGSHGGGGGGQARAAPSELAAHPIAELPG